MEAHRSSKALLALKIFLALLAGAVVPALIVIVVFSISYASTQAADASVPSDPGSISRDHISAAATAFLFAFAFTAAHAFILGLPAVLLGIKLRAIRWWSCILVSFLIGFIPTGWAFGGNIMNAVPAGGLGVIGGLTFWLVWHFWVQRTPAKGTGMPIEPAATPTATNGG